MHISHIHTHHTHTHNHRYEVIDKVSEFGPVYYTWTLAVERLLGLLGVSLIFIYLFFALGGGGAGGRE
jgi:hypothetical protein